MVSDFCHRGILGLWSTKRSPCAPGDWPTSHTVPVFVSPIERKKYGGPQVSPSPHPKIVGGDIWDISVSRTGLHQPKLQSSQGCNTVFKWGVVRKSEVIKKIHTLNGPRKVAWDADRLILQPPATSSPQPAECRALEGGASEGWGVPVARQPFLGLMGATAVLKRLGRACSAFSWEPPEVRAGERGCLLTAGDQLSAWRIGGWDLCTGHMNVSRSVFSAAWCRGAWKGKCARTVALRKSAEPAG